MNVLHDSVPKGCTLKSVQCKSQELEVISIDYYVRFYRKKAPPSATLQHLRVPRNR